MLRHAELVSAVARYIRRTVLAIFNLELTMVYSIEVAGAANLRPTDVRLLTLPEVVLLVKLKKTSIYKQMRLGGFPLSYKASSGAVRWKLNEIEDWMRNLRH